MNFAKQFFGHKPNQCRHGSLGLQKRTLPTFIMVIEFPVYHVFAMFSLTKFVQIWRLIEHYDLNQLQCFLLN